MISPSDHPPGTPQHATATLFAAVAASGTVETVRDTVHAIFGIVGDLCGVAISLLTLAWWIRIWLTRHRPPAPR